MTRLAALSHRWQWNEVVAVGREAWSRQPSSAVGWMLVEALLALGKVDDAEAVLEQGLALEPSSTLLMSSRASLLFGSGEQRRAIALMSELVSQHPDDEALAASLSLFLLESGDLEQALRVAERAQRDSGSGEADAALGYVCVKLRRGQDALRAFDQHSRRNASDPVGRYRTNWRSSSAAVRPPSISR